MLTLKIQIFGHYEAINAFKKSIINMPVVNMCSEDYRVKSYSSKGFLDELKSSLVLN